MRQSTTTACTQDSVCSNLAVIIGESLFASTAMELDCSYYLDFDNESISEDYQTDVFSKRTSGICFDFPPSQHFVAERDDESCSSSMMDETQANTMKLKSPQFSVSTEITAIMTWESSFDDMDDDLLPNEIQGIQQIFEPSDAQFHTHSFMEESTSNCVFRDKEDCDYKRRGQYANIVRMKQENYEHEQPQASLKSSLKVLSSTLNRLPNSPTQLKYPDEKGQEEVLRRQFLREHAAEQQIYCTAQKHNLVMCRAA